MKFKDNLRRFREKAGYKQAKEFAKAADIPYPSYSAYENGRWPNEKNLVKIAKTLKISIDDLVGYTPDQPDELEKAIQFLKDGGIKFAEVSPPGNVSIYFVPQWLKDRGVPDTFPVVYPNEIIIEIYKNAQNYLKKIQEKSMGEVVERAISDFVLADFVAQGIQNGSIKLSHGYEPTIIKNENTDTKK